MDILNWLYIRRQQLIKTTPNNAQTDLVALGAEVPFSRRDDGYQTYAMTLADLSNAGDVANTGYYTIDLNTTITNTVDVTTAKGAPRSLLKPTLFCRSLVIKQLSSNVNPLDTGM